MPEWSKVARRIRVPLGFAFAVLYFWLARPSWRSVEFSVFLIIPGLLIRAMASGHVSKNEALATSGPYAYTRNPLYLGSLLIGLGFALASRSWWIGVLLLAMFFFIYIPVIRGEEKFLREHFPEFDGFAREVPRMFLLFGRPGNAANTAPAAFSPNLYIKHREYNAALGSMLLLLALIIRMIWFR